MLREIFSRDSISRSKSLLHAGISLCKWYLNPFVRIREMSLEAKSQIQTKNNSFCYNSRRKLNCPDCKILVLQPCYLRWPRSWPPSWLTRCCCPCPRWRGLTTPWRSTWSWWTRLNNVWRDWMHKVRIRVTNIFLCVAKIFATYKWSFGRMNEIFR